MPANLRLLLKQEQITFPPILNFCRDYEETYIYNCLSYSQTYANTISLATIRMDCMETDELSDWGDLLAWKKIHIECSLPGRKLDPRFSHRREDCECVEDVAALLKLHSYELLMDETNGSWRGLAWIDERCKYMPTLCKENPCEHGSQEYECRGLPSLSFLVKKDSRTSTFIDELLRNTKLHAVVWNGLDGTPYKPREFEAEHLATRMSRSLPFGNWVREAGPLPKQKLTLEDCNLQHLKYEVYICDVAMGMKWEDYSGMDDKEFYDAIEKFNIIDEIVSVLEKAGVKPRNIK